MFNNDGKFIFKISENYTSITPREFLIFTCRSYTTPYGVRDGKPSIKETR